MPKTLFVNGTLMRGLALHKNLVGAVFLGEFKTKPKYRVFSIDDVHPAMYEVGDGGVAVAGELYQLPDDVWQRVSAGEPPHLYDGPVELEDGRIVDGILYPRDKIGPAHVDISAFGGWRRYMDSKKGGIPMKKHIVAEPYDLAFDPRSTALMVIDMQRDFLEEGGFGTLLGNDVSLLRAAIDPCKALLRAARASGLRVLHTREGHDPTLADCPPSKKARGKLTTGIGDQGPMGRILVRGETGHGIIPELAPLGDEPIIDKPGKGSFYATDLDLILRNYGIATLLICGVTTEVCVTTTVREANDRGYECVVASDAVASYFPEYNRMALEMIKAQGGIFGWVTTSKNIIDAIV